MTRIALLWHMHQPFYEDLLTGEHVLPWVRLHGLKDYFGMVALLREFPEVRVTFNLVPSLLVQIEAFAGNRARDRHLELGLKPAADLTSDDRAFVLANFFHAQRARMIDPYPRYAELLARREAGNGPGNGAGFTEADLRDLQVWHKLAWLDPFYLEGDRRATALVEKGRGFTEDDKHALREIELEILGRIIPEYRDAAARGQIEISTSPFYHPILPLLCDTDVFLRTHPQSAMPRRRFRHAEDAAEQLRRARACHERLFGQAPRGVWPSEGSVSDAMVPLVAGAGFSWMATDEVILARSLRASLTRDAHGNLEQPEILYRPYRVGAAGADVACLFRDHTLSDLIGFTYAGWSAQAAAADFIRRLVEAGRRYSSRTGRGEAVVPVILDGENAWEHFEGGGRPFLRALYAGLTDHPELRTVTMAEAAALPAGSLDGMFPGSWINGDFYIWIGHRDDHCAWTQLADARQALDAHGPAASEAARAQAVEEMLIAEGSDWFWWYGDDHSSEHDLEFDDLFRRHVRNVYRALGRPVPEELFVTNISTEPPRPEAAAPTALVRCVPDGRVTSYFEWLGAGTLDVRPTAGAMRRASPGGPLVRSVSFGFDLERLHVRVDADRPAADLLAGGYEVALAFLVPPRVRLVVGMHAGEPAGTLWDENPDGQWVARATGNPPRVGAQRILECSVPFTELGLAPGDRLRFFVALLYRGQEVERHPSFHPIELDVPTAAFASLNWTA